MFRELQKVKFKKNQEQWTGSFKNKNPPLFYFSLQQTGYTMFPFLCELLLWLYVKSQKSLDSSSVI